ncbi:MAG: Rnase Y domain-containing protein, partial [Prevotella sp.]|nr:Rnase Y domain-containing protein [Prevotella sp.]
MTKEIIIAIAVAALIIGGLIGYLIFRYVIKGKYNEMLANAEKAAEVLKEKKLLEVKEKFINKKSELEREVQQRNQKIQQTENRLKQREINLNQKQDELGKRNQELDQMHQRIENEKKLLALKEQELSEMQMKEREKLEQLSGLS